MFLGKGNSRYPPSRIGRRCLLPIDKGEPPVSILAFLACAPMSPQNETGTPKSVAAASKMPEGTSGNFASSRRSFGGAFC